MTIWQNIRLCIVAEHGILVVEHLFFYFLLLNIRICMLAEHCFIFYEKTRGSFWRTFWLGCTTL